MSKNWLMFFIMMLGFSNAEEHPNVMYGCCINAITVIPCDSSMVKNFMCAGIGCSVANDCFATGVKVFCILKRDLLISLAASKSWKTSKSVEGFGCGFSFKLGRR
ncbi:MAG: hypothetical protein KAH32_01680 [Chlamydiia bacterium]|nr:hypothetical protein [Chlamydiia bacterium]